MKKFISLLAFIFSTYFCFGQIQEFKSNHPTNVGDISQKFEKRYDFVLNETFYEARDVRLVALRSAALSLLFESSMLKSGNTVFDDKADLFVRAIGNHLVSKNKSRIKDSLNFYVSRTSALNAFATDNGNIWVTTGLLSKIQNEAQLAFVLCHEISHYIEQHNLQNTTEMAKASYAKGSFKFLSLSEKESVVHSFSKDLETEADELGYELFINAGYNPSTYLSVFDILAKCILPHNMEVPKSIFPFSEIEFVKDMHYSVPSFNQDSLENDDEATTHPSIALRRENLIDIEQNAAKKIEGKDYLVTTPESLKNIVSIAEYSLGSYYLRDLNFYMALSQNTMLATKYPEDAQLKANILKAWYGMFMYKTKTIDAEVYSYYTQYGETNIFQKWMTDMTEEVLIGNLIGGSWALLQKDSANEQYQELLSLSLELVDNYVDDKYNSVTDLVDNLFGDASSELTTYLSGMQDDVIMAYVRNIRSKKLAQTISENSFLTDGVLFVNPVALKIEETSYMAVNLKESERMNRNLEADIAFVANKYGVRHKIISSTESLKNDPQGIDDIYLAGLLLRQYAFKAEDSDPSAYNLLATPQQLDDLVTRHNCRYLVYSRAMYTKKKVRLIITGAKLIGMGGYFPAYMPALITGSYLYRNQMETSFLVYDMKLNRYVYVQNHWYKRASFGGSAQRLTVQNEFYEMLTELK